jgi:GxxExxY protein
MNHSLTLAGTNDGNKSVMDNEANLFSKEGYALMAAAFEVHNEQGGGLLEDIYQESLELELGDRGIPFVPKKELVIYYKGRQLKKRYLPDLYIDDGIVVELKSVSALAPEHEAQVINYMRISKRRVGYLINFGPIKGVEWKRFVI